MYLRWGSWLRKHICSHYIDVMITTMASQITSVSSACPAVCSGKENIKTPRHWPVWGEFTGDLKITRKIFPFTVIYNYDYLGQKTSRIMKYHSHLFSISIYSLLTHWGRVTHICVGELTNIGSDNGLWPERRRAIIWTNAGILLIGPLGTNFSEILIRIHTFSLKKMHLKMSSGKWRPFFSVSMC